MKNFIWRWLIMFFLAVCCKLTAQNGRLQLAVDSTQMTIGDYNRASLRLSGVNQVTPHLLTTLQDTTQSIEVLSEEAWVPTGQEVVKQIIFSVYDTGVVWLPAQTVVAGTDTLIAEGIPLQVKGVPIDSSGLAPIKDIITEPLSWKDFLPVVFILVGILSIVAVTFWLIKRRNKTPVLLPVTPPLPPLEIALQKLKDLEQKAPWENGEIKAFQTDLTFIVREYLENQYQLPALERTTAEIISDAQDKQLSEAWVTQLKELLTTADFVKFAKAQPPVDIHPQMLIQARQLLLTSENFSSPGGAIPLSEQS